MKAEEVACLIECIHEVEVNVQFYMALCATATWMISKMIDALRCVNNLFCHGRMTILHRHNFFFKIASWDSVSCLRMKWLICFYFFLEVWLMVSTMLLSKQALARKWWESKRAIVINNNTYVYWGRGSQQAWVSSLNSGLEGSYASLQWLWGPGGGVIRVITPPPFDFDNKSRILLMPSSFLLALMVLSAQHYFQTKHECDLQSLNHTHNYVGVGVGVTRSTPSIWKFCIQPWRYVCWPHP